MSESKERRRYAIERLELRCLLSVGDSYVPPVDPRQTIDLSPSWKFLRSDAAGAQNVGFNDSSWSTVDVPHSWNALDGQDGGNNYYRGIGWYRKTLTVPATFSGKSITLQFGGSSLVSDVYIDGTFALEHRGAFGAWNVDVTNTLAPGPQHLIAVKVDNSASLSSTVAPVSADFNVNGGIYRKVTLLGTASERVSTSDFGSSGVFFSSSNASSASADIQVRSEITNGTAGGASVLIHDVLVDQSGTIVADTSSNQALAANQTLNLTQTATVANPHLWNGRLDPYLHDLYVEVRDPSTNQLLDLVHQRVGIRSYTISPTQGFLLNGVPYDLHGVNMHQDRLNKAWAISDDDIRQDMSLVFEVGATMLRTAHYEQSQLFYDLADQYGIVIWVEVPVVNSTSGGSSAFASNAQDQLRELIRQNFNHPSIIVWSLYNEIADNSTNDSFVTNENNLAHSEDPTRLTVGASSDASVGTLEKITNAVGLNRYYGWYYGVPGDLAAFLDSQHAANPTVAIGISEYGAGAGITQHQQDPTTVVAASLWHPEEYQTYFHEQEWRIMEARPWLWTKLIWNMFDFAVDGRNEGDTPGRNDKGLVTYDRQTKKDSFYFYKANWSSDPVLYITSRRWVERSAALTSIKVYSNVDNNPVVTINGVPQGALLDQGDHIWLLSNVTLAAGNNTVVVTGTRAGQTYTDTVMWHYTPAPVPGLGQIKVNFQPADSGPTAAGYLIDNGLVFGNRGNGLQYGWNVDNTANARRRGVNPDVKSDTLIHMQRNGTFTWEYALANGTYDVLIAAGDPSFADSIHSFSVEGVAVTDPDGMTNYNSYTARVQVTDGRLTLVPTGVNAKIDFIEMSLVDTTPPSVTSGIFQYETGHSIAVQFNEAMDAATIQPSDLLVQTAVNGPTYAPATVSYLPATNTAVFSFSTPLRDANYTATLAAGSVSDLAGNATSQDFSFGFFALAGDANHDTYVDGLDFIQLAANFNQPAMTFSQGDFNYDGVVNSLDFNILATNFGTQLPSPAPSLFGENGNAGSENNKFDLSV